MDRQAVEAFNREGRFKEKTQPGGLALSEMCESKSANADRASGDRIGDQPLDVGRQLPTRDASN